jgi:hypothetical protein
MAGGNGKRQSMFTHTSAEGIFCFLQLCAIAVSWNKTFKPNFCVTETFHLPATYDSSHRTENLWHGLMQFALIFHKKQEKYLYKCVTHKIKT